MKKLSLLILLSFGLLGVVVFANLQTPISFTNATASQNSLKQSVLLSVNTSKKVDKTIHNFIQVVNQKSDPISVYESVLIKLNMKINQGTQEGTGSLAQLQYAFDKILGEGLDPLCVKDGGKVQQVGKLQSYQCVYSYDDGGNSCSSSADCKGDCIVTNSDGSDPHCSDSSNNFGCFASVESFDKIHSIICRD